MSADIHTKALVLRRTNFGESDRILSLLTEQGVVHVLAHSARKEKSKLAGGIEMFCVSDVIFHYNKNNPMGILTSAKMLKYYQNILADLSRLELASFIVKQTSRVAEADSGPAYFSIMNQCFAGIDNGYDLGLVESWFLFNLAKASGEQVNLLYDASGHKLQPNQTYVWDIAENSLRPDPHGNISSIEIKLMRLMLSANLELIYHVQDLLPHIPPVLHVAKSVNKL